MELWLASLLELVNLDLTAAVWEWYIYIVRPGPDDFCCTINVQAMINS